MPDIKGRATRIVVELPFPDKDLSPNARVHHQQKAAVTKQARALAAAETRLNYNLSEYSGNLICCRYFYPPDNRWRDTDNLGSMAKASQDGIADALGINDHLIIETRNRRMKSEGKPGKVVFEIYADEEEQ